MSGSKLQRERGSAGRFPDATLTPEENPPDSRPIPGKPLPSPSAALCRERGEATRRTGMARTRCFNGGTDAGGDHRAIEAETLRKALTSRGSAKSCGRVRISVLAKRDAIGRIARASNRRCALHHSHGAGGGGVVRFTSSDRTTIPSRERADSASLVSSSAIGSGSVTHTSRVCAWSRSLAASDCPSFSISAIRASAASVV